MEMMHPGWCLAALALVLPLALAALWRGHRRRRRILACWPPGPEGNKAETDASPGRRAWRNGLLLVAMAVACVALGRPRLSGMVEASSASGDMVLLLDCSRSMAAEDMQPSRLHAAVACASGLVRRTAARRLALIAFAGEAFAECPLTSDRDAVLAYLERLDCETIPLGGTDFGRAFAECERLLAASGDTGSAIVLFSDGEETGEGEAGARLPGGLRFLAVGVGDPERASSVPGTHGPLLDPASGQPVASRPDFVSLGALARRSGGEFLPMAGTPPEMAERIAVRLGESLGTAPSRGIGRAGVRELAPWLAAVALLCVLARWSVGERRPCRAALLVAILVGAPSRGSPDVLFEQGLSLLRAGRASEAVVAWELAVRAPDLPPDVLLATRLNLGVAHHLLGRQLAREEGTRSRALTEFALAEACYAACVWDEGQRARAARNLARLARDREEAAPAPSGTDGAKPPPATSDAPEPPPDEGKPQEGTAPGDGGEGEGSSNAPGDEPPLDSEEAARIAERMGRNEGDFNEALRRKQARTWRTAPPKRPW